MDGAFPEHMLYAWNSPRAIANNTHTTYEGRLSRPHLPGEELGSEGPLLWALWTFHPKWESHASRWGGSNEILMLGAVTHTLKLLLESGEQPADLWAALSTYTGGSLQQGFFQLTFFLSCKLNFVKHSPGGKCPARPRLGDV